MTPAPAEDAITRGRERDRRIAWSTLAGISARAIGLAVSLVSVPLLIGYLGTERYGLWLTLTAIVAMLGPLDLGVGNAVVTLTAEAMGARDEQRVRSVIVTAIGLLTAIALIAGLAYLLAAPLIPWAGILNLNGSAAATDAPPAAAAVIACFLLGLPVGVIGRAQFGFQEAYIANVWLALGGVISFGFLLIGIAARAPLPILMLGFVSGTLVSGFVNALVLFGRQRPWLRPRRDSLALGIARKMLRTGTLFFVLQMAIVVGMQSDNVVIAQLLGVEAVPGYAVPMRLFTLVPTLLGFALAPLWPAYSEALARGDRKWAGRTLRRSIVVALAVNTPAAIGLILIGPAILHLWVGDAVRPEPLLLVSLGAWTFLNSFTGPMAMFLVGANVVGFQVVFALLGAASNIAISIVLVQSVGVAGAAIGSVISQIIFAVIPSTWYLRRFLRGPGRLGEQPA